MKVTQMPPVHAANLVANSGNTACGVDVIRHPNNILQWSGKQNTIICLQQMSFGTVVCRIPAIWLCLNMLMRDIWIDWMDVPIHANTGLQVASLQMSGWYTPGGGGTHSTTNAPPFRPPFFRSLENLYSFDPIILAKMRKMYFDPYFSSKLGKMYSFDPTPFFFNPCSISSRRAVMSIPIRNETWPSSPPRVPPHPTPRGIHSTKSYKSK